MKKVISGLLISALFIAGCASIPRTGSSGSGLGLLNIMGVEGDVLKLDSIPKVVVESSESTVDKSSVKTIVSIDQDECTLPTRVGDILGLSKFRLFKFNKNLTAEAKAMGFSGSIGTNEMVFIKEYVRWNDVTCKGKAKKIGIGIRCFIHVKTADGKFGANLPWVAASVQLGQAEATYELTSLGFAINGSDLVPGLAPDGSFDVENYAKLDQTFYRILAQLDDKSEMKIRPAELP